MSRAESPPRRVAARETAAQRSRVEVCQSGAQPAVGEMEAASRRLDGSFQWVTLMLSTAVVALSFALSNRGEEQVVVPLLGFPLPPMCASKTILGIDCPGCGMTRSFISVAHGDLLAAWHFNPAGVLFFAVVAAQIPLRSIQLWRLRRGRRPLDLSRLQVALWLVVGGMLLQWAVKLGGRLFG